MNQECLSHVARGLRRVLLALALALALALLLLATVRAGTNVQCACDLEVTVYSIMIYSVGCRQDVNGAGGMCSLGHKATRRHDSVSHG